MSDKLTMAVIGLGIGRHHARYFSENPAVGRVIGVDVDPDRIALIGKTVPFDATYTDYKGMLKAEKIDGVSVSLPNHMHAPVTIDCLRAGVNVVCEKPMATTVREARRMIDAATKADRLLMIHFNHRFNPELLYLKKVIDDGVLGDIYFAKTAWHRRNGIPGKGRSWFFTKEQSGGGPLIDLGVHRLDLTLYMMGYPDPVTVSGSAWNHLGRKIKGEDYDVEDMATGYVRFDNGATLIVEASWASHSEKQENFYTELYGVEGGALQRNVGEMYDTELKIFTEQSGSRVDIVPKEVHRLKQTAADHFVDCLMGRCACLATGEHGMKVMRIIEGLYKSAEQGKEVKV